MPLNFSIKTEEMKITEHNLTELHTDKFQSDKKEKSITVWAKVQK